MRRSPPCGGTERAAASFRGCADRNRRRFGPGSRRKRREPMRLVQTSPGDSIFQAGRRQKASQQPAVAPTSGQATPWTMSHRATGIVPV